MKRPTRLAAACALLTSLSVAAHADQRAPESLVFELDDGNHMAAHLYGASAEAPLVVLIHGASDTHAVFDFAPGYAIARDLARRGYGVLAIDRVGYGLSSRPNGDGLTFAAQAAQVQQVVAAVRAGALGFDPPSVVLAGPSLGADVALVTAGTYGDVDGVIIAFHSSELQPELFEVDVGAWLAQGDYFDFGPQFRRAFFYSPTTPAWIVESDNATRSRVPRGEILDALGSASAPMRAEIDVPVLLLQAELDALFVPRDDSALFTSSPDVTFRRLRNAGHKGFSHPTGKAVAVEVITAWLDARF